MSDFNVGDRVEILSHKNSEYKGKLGKISFIGAGLRIASNESVTQLVELRHK